VLGLDGQPLIVAPSRLSGITLLSREAADDGGLNVTAQVEAALRDKYSAVVDRDLLSGSGAGAVPAGLIAAAAEVAGASLWAATVAAKTQIAAAGGTASHLAVHPDVIGAEEGRTDQDGRPLWPDGLATFAGVTVVRTAGATVPLVYDAARVYLVVRSDYEPLLSADYAPAFERYAVALRLVVRLAAAAPAPLMSMRKLDVTDPPEPIAAQAAARPRQQSGRCA
jgi:HK97 family phage major capsid protein